DELVAAVGGQEGLDSRRLVQLARGEIVRDLNVVGVHRPGPHDGRDLRQCSQDVYPAPVGQVTSPRVVRSRADAACAAGWPPSAVFPPRRPALAGCSWPPRSTARTSRRPASPRRRARARAAHRGPGGAPAGGWAPPPAPPPPPGSPGFASCNP